MPLRIPIWLAGFLACLNVALAQSAEPANTNASAVAGDSHGVTPTLSTPIQPTWTQLMNGSLEGQWIEVLGMAGRVQNRADGWSILTLHTSHGDLKVNLLRSALPDGKLEDKLRSLVRLRGHLVVDRAPETQRVITGQIRLRDLQIIVDRPPPADMFAVPLQSATSLTLANPDYAPFRWVRVRGQIIHVRSRLFFMMDNGAGVRFSTDDFLDLKPGDLVEVTGYQDVLSAAAPVLRAAVARKLGAAPLPAPRQLSSEELVQPGFDARWIRVQGVLTGIKQNKKDSVLEMRAGDRRFWSRLSLENGSLPPLRIGSELELTGVYCAQGEYKVLGPDVAALDLFLNSPSGIRILSAPSWWTLERLLVVTGVLACLLLATGLWITQLHRQVEQRTAELAAQIQERQRVEHLRTMEQERTRIAQDLHDDLGSHITAVSMLVERAKLGGVSESQQTRYLDQLGETARTMTTTLDEIVWTMNPRHDSLASLVGYLGSFAERFLALAGIAPQLEVPVKLPEIQVVSQTRHQLFMVFKEALANVVRHAAATEVKISFVVAADQLRCEIADNGRGLTGENREDGMNGIANMKERIEKLGGQFQITSGAGAGTTVRFEAPFSGSAA